MCILHASPFNPDARGFNFSSVEEFNDTAGKLRDRYGAPVEEFEILFIDGDDPQLFEACRIDQTNLSKWFDDVESLLDDGEKAQLFYLLDCVGYNLSDALEKCDEVALYDGPLIDAASQLFDDVYLSEIPEAVRPYIDYEAFAHDCRLGGVMCEFEFGGSTWTATNAGEV